MKRIERPFRYLVVPLLALGWLAIAACGGSSGDSCTDCGTGGTGGAEGPLCERMCAHIYEDCGGSFGDARTGAPMSQEGCVDACDAGLFTDYQVECLAVTACNQAGYDACFQRQATSCDAMCAQVYGCGFSFRDAHGPVDEAACTSACDTGYFTPEERDCYGSMECTPDAYWSCVTGPVSELCIDACTKMVDTCDVWRDQSPETVAACRVGCMEEWPTEMMECVVDSDCGALAFCVR